MFTALAVTIQNNGDSDATIVSVEMSGLKNNKSAAIDFSGDATAVALTPGDTQTNILASFSDVDFDHGGTKYDLLTGGQITADNKGQFILMWPQSSDEVEDISFTVKYTFDGIYDDQDPTKLYEYEAVCNLGDAVTALEAGCKYSINLQFKGKSLDFRVVVMPWDAQYFDLDYSKSTIQALPTALNEGVLWLYTWDYDSNNNSYRWYPGPRDRKITMDSGKNIKGDFTILSPTSGQWQITTYPADAAQYFTITPSSGNIDDLVDEGGNFKGLVEFIISPNGVVTSAQKLYFNVDIQINGVWKNANSEFNRKNWELTRLP